MFIQDFIQINSPFTEVKRRLTPDPSLLLQEKMAAAYHDGEQLSVRIGPAALHGAIGKMVDVEFYPSQETTQNFIIPFHWWAVGATRLFPHLEGDLVVSPLGDTETMITMRGTYDPPLGTPGLVINQLVLHHLAEASLRSFLTRLGASF